MGSTGSPTSNTDEVRHGRRTEARRPQAAADRSGSPAEVAREHRRALREDRERVRREAVPRRRRAAAERRPRDQPRLHGTREAALVRPGEARRDAGPRVGRLPEALAGHDREGDRRPARAREGSGPRRQPLQERAVGEQLPVRLHQAVVPDHRRPRAAHGRRDAGPRLADGAQGEVLHAAVRRCARADQLRADESRGAEGDERVRRTEPAQGPRASPEGSRTRPRQARDQHDRLRGVQARRERRHDARQGHLPERPDAAAAVRADDAAGRQARRC